MLQASLLAVALTCIVLLEINGLLVMVLAVVVLAHWLAGYVDVRYSAPRRAISPVEQSIHGFLELLPVFAVVLLGLDAAQAGRLADWKFVAADTSIATAALFLGLNVVVLGTPLAEEGWRCLRFRRNGSQEDLQIRPSE